ncbi:hypothetical protein PtA15_3A349 [Puccinia triticina]|uniref:Uncharacterized protein n=2 Tax=Puccinia triticina TaxID=208348 RepID=A0ABY7CDI5_9BASI|nr:uncharacterized protein PtA15_3A349 [Puccinia triticina]WAQ82983.1 hypothetical protein PtA15_3A349 [Puccinia triticina]WAR53809.1 hypothetical protein PtB15_3B318 [Puccinia triticina]
MSGELQRKQKKNDAEGKENCERQGLGDGMKKLRRDDDGGQYDSNGGEGGRGNPANSFCSPYHAYVQLIEPLAKRACIRCCQNPFECDLSNDVRGCPVVIPGKYFTCA